VTSPAAVRWFLAFLLLLTGSLLMGSLLPGAGITPDVLQALSLLGMVCAVLAWRWYPPAAGFFVSLALSMLVMGAWAVREHAALWRHVGAFVILTGAAILHWRRRTRRAHHRRQQMEALHEARRVNDQEIVLAHQASEALSKKLARYAQLQSIAEALSKTTTLESVAQLAVEHTLTLIGKSDVCLLLLVDAQRQALSLIASKKREATLSVRAKHGDQFDRHVVRTHQPLLVTDVRRDFRFTVPIAAQRPVQSVIACPLLLDQRPEGVLRLDSSRTGAYTQDDLRLLDVLADLVATAVVNAKLFAQVQRLAVTDGLTGLSLRRPFLEQLTYELTRAGRGGGHVSVLMLDVDQFKRYNDTWGHLAGDALLKSVGQLLRDAVPAGGLVARYGGDEFGVLLPRLGREQAQDIAEAIRQRVPRGVHGRARGSMPPATSSAPGATAAQETPVTVSIGVASSPDDAQMGIELIRIADHRLYQAKRAGRNRVSS